MLTQIEFVIYKSQDTKKSNSKRENKQTNMKLYYIYWERKIYNALVKMVIRGLLTFKALISPPGHQAYPLFKVSTEFHYNKVITIPH